MRYINVLVVCLVLLGIVCGGCTGRGGNILLTGYWPPTNEMLRQFSTDEQLNWGKWEGEKWRGTNFDVYAYFPTFEDGTAENPQGNGVLRVDYQRTQADFERLVEELKPVAIVSFGQGAGPWEIEYNAVNLAKWYDDYEAPTQPDVLPIDDSVGAGFVRHSSLPVEAIKEAINNSGLGIRAWVDYEGDPGTFLCNYMAYQVSRYKEENGPDGNKYPCFMAGFIHVGGDVEVDKAARAVEITLEEVVESLKDCGCF